MTYRLFDYIQYQHKNFQICADTIEELQADVLEIITVMANILDNDFKYLSSTKHLYTCQLLIACVSIGIIKQF